MSKVATKKKETKKPNLKVVKPAKKSKESVNTKAKKVATPIKASKKAPKKEAPKSKVKEAPKQAKKSKPKASRVGIGGRPSLGDKKKQRQQIFLEPRTVTFLEKLAKRLAVSREAKITATQVEAEILENYVKNARLKAKEAKETNGKVKSKKKKKG